MTIEEALAWGISQLGTDADAKVDCRLLLMQVLGVNSAYLMTWPERELTLGQQVQFEATLGRRCKGEPIAYIIGYRDFWDLTLAVNPSTLIPRPETELLVEQVIQLDIKAAQCLDLGTGTGAIALAIASEKPNWQIMASDYVADAVALAKRNAKSNQVNNVTIVQSHWLQNISGQFDVIVSNPPYVEAGSPYLQQGDLRFEPETALVAGGDGLDDIRTIIADGKPYLKPGGLMYLEHGWQQGQAIRCLFTESGYLGATTLKDLNQLDRITFAHLPSH